MAPSNPVRSSYDRRQRRLLIVLALGFSIFGAAASVLFYALKPEILRIAVGPAGSDDHQVVQAMIETFEEESRTVKLLPLTTKSATESLALLGAGKADLAIGRGDLDMPTTAQTMAVLRKNYVVLWAPSARSRKEPRVFWKIREIADLAQRKVAIVGMPEANLTLLRTILAA